MNVKNSPFFTKLTEGSYKYLKKKKSNIYPLVYIVKYRPFGINWQICFAVFFQIDKVKHIWLKS